MRVSIHDCHHGFDGLEPRRKARQGQGNSLSRLRQVKGASAPRNAGERQTSPKRETPDAQATSQGRAFHSVVNTHPGESQDSMIDVNSITRIHDGSLTRVHR